MVKGGATVNGNSTLWTVVAVLAIIALIVWLIQAV